VGWGVQIYYSPNLKTQCLPESEKVTARGRTYIAAKRGEDLGARRADSHLKQGEKRVHFLINWFPVGVEGVMSHDQTENAKTK